MRLLQWRDTVPQIGWETAMSETIPVFNAVPRVRLVHLDRPWTWLRAGWLDLLRTPQASLTYGAGLAAISAALTLGLWLAGVLYLLLPLSTGFALIAPMLAVGVYDLSRRQESSEPTDFRSTLGVLKRNVPQLALMGLVLALLHLVWVRVAILLYALFFSGQNPTLPGAINNILFTNVGLAFLVVGSAIGFGLAVLAFAISAVSLPMLVDRPVSVFAAIATSVAAVRLNVRPLALWAALIAGFIAFGVVTFYLGLIVVVPLIGHATWHAYRDLVEMPD
jgi:uncharacterized membrane protein